ncbi:MAG TPA: response regulator [Nitriliruptorales bacterium]|nr:response regulator [Nitriliruptorales bacterium]
MSALVLIVDDDPDIRDIVEINLQSAGFDVATAADGERGLEQALRLRPELVLLDLMMPRIDGYEVCRRLRTDARTSHIPIIMLTARAQPSDRVSGLELGADDYLTKPFDVDELIARIHATLRRVRDTRSVSPLTGLPGNVRIERELAQRVNSGEQIALLYADLNRFKPFNDRYGFLRGDEAIGTLADAVCDVVASLGDETTFVGHVGGDDFVIITRPEAGETIGRALIERFDARVPELYDPADREAGFIEVRDRQGRLHRYPFVSVAIGMVTTTPGAFSDHRQLAEVAAEMKNYAKRLGDGSNLAVDRRSRP